MGCVTCWLFYTAIALIIFKLYNKLTAGWCRSQTCLVGKTVIVTGANTGIGYETAIDLAKRGAKVILACRNEDKAQEACQKIIKETDNKKVSYKLVDFFSLKSVRNFAEEINKSEERLDILVNNAGAGNFGARRSEDGLQLLVQVNYFAPFLLTNLLLDLLKKSGPSRIVNVSSLAANFAGESLNVDELYDLPVNRKLYGKTKLCNILFTIELASRLRGTKVTTYSLHPGVIITDIFRSLPYYVKLPVETMIALFMKNPIEGAQTTIYCAVQKGIEEYSGEHFADCHLVTRYKAADDPGLPKKLWEKTEQIVKFN